MIAHDGEGQRALQLEDWDRLGALRPLDLALTRFIRAHGPETDPWVLLAIALTSARTGQGHICLDLKAALESPHTLLTAGDADLPASPGPGAELAAWLATLTLDDWVARLTQSSVIEKAWASRPPSDTTAAKIAAPQSEPAPLVLGGTPERPLLYLRRYWTYEQRIQAGLSARLHRTLDQPEDRMRALLEVLFEAEESGTLPWQRIACALAACRAFAIITGGPGTGKTTTVVRLLALLQSLALEAGASPLRIRLAAPTGKAAARLNESIAGQVERLPFDRLPDIRPAIPIQAVTLHRLLGPLPDSRGFRYRAGHPLPADLVVVDEASMLDVELMAALLDALRPEARLILLGDQDQLASVEAGAVLGDLCRRARAAHYTPKTRDWLERVTGARLPEALIDPAGRPLDQAIVMLRHSYRFRAEGGIGALAELVNTGRLDGAPVSAPCTALDTLFARRSDPSLGQIRRIRLSDERDPRFDQLVFTAYWGRSGYLALLHEQRPPDDAPPEAFDAWARAVLRAQAGFQLLTALRQGPWGAEGLNRRIQHRLSQGPDASSLGARTSTQIQIQGGQPWFEGRPVLVTCNDYRLGLMNGDIGITLRVPVKSTPPQRWERGQGEGAQPSSVLRVAFPSGDGSDAIRWILPSRLQNVETVFAMTVHKSQGSEFDHTALILPPVSSPVLTRELLYTAITRAKSVFTLIDTQEEVLCGALGRRVERASGLALALDSDQDASLNEDQPSARGGASDS
ncbi:exodeoxyribonuclease V subunit alpha [Thermochromatium tepidum ATCC 43061]|uniref:RecBCD enzyme subunit RecD n=2 Tax=Thermochromatium tepidum TaxID=1050 RepID=A0A6I6EBD8_THETI|nr:exodeoxyribonuclease V subunit alpha [Thermochromatium tepidum ATCC 43061]